MTHGPIGFSKSLPKNLTRTTLALIALAFLLPFPPATAQHPVPGVCLVLSGGGARGAAHIGVLKVLEREKIPIDMVVGTSSGALVGGLYCLGYTPDEIEKMFVGEEWAGIFRNAPDVALNPFLARTKARYQAEINFRGYAPELPTGLVAGQRLTELLDGITTDRMLAAGFDFDALPVPFRAVATDLATGKRFVFRNGSMTEAIRASVSVPFLFEPVEKGDMLLADGGLVDNLPTDVARELGAGVVIAVDVTSPLFEKEQLKTFLEIMDQSISLGMRRSVEENRRLADIVLRPDLANRTAIDYSRIPEIVQLGVAEAERKIDALKTLLPGPTVPRPVHPAVQTVTATIATVAFDGLKEVPAGQLRKDIGVKPGDRLDTHALINDLARIYATGLFEFADFRLMPADPGSYHLVFVVREAAMRTLGAGIRYDRDYGVVALMEFNARQIFHTPSKFTFTSQFGGLDLDSARFDFIPSHRRPFFFLSPEVHYGKREHRNFSNGEFVDKFTEKRAGAQFMLGTILRRFEFRIGYEMNRITGEGNLPEELRGGALQSGGIRLDLNRNTLDAQGFPGKGSLLAGRYDNCFRALGSRASFTRYEINISKYFPVTEKSNLQFHGTAGHSRGDMPAQESFYVGGFSFSEGGARRLMGFGFDEFPARQMWIAAGAYRYRWLSRPFGFVRNAFVTGYYNAAGISARQRSPYAVEVFHGAGADFSFDTLIGPLHLTAGMGQGGRFHFYLTLGPSF